MPLIDVNLKMLYRRPGEVLTFICQFYSLIYLSFVFVFFLTTAWPANEM